MRLRVPRSLVLAASSLLAISVLAAVCGCSKSSRVKGSKYMGKGEDAISKGRIRKAIVCFEKEIELNPKNPTPYLRLALIYEHLHKDPGKAKDCYEQYFKRETNKAKREHVESWRDELDDTLPLLDVPALPASSQENGETADAALLEELEQTRRKLRKAEQSNEEFAKRIIELEGLHDELQASTAAIKRLTKERDDLKVQSETRAESLASLKGAFDELKTKSETDIEKASKEIARLEDKIAALEARNKDLKDERSRAGRRSLSKRLDETRKALKAAEDRNVEYARQVAELQSNIAELEAGRSSSTGDAPRALTHMVQEGETLMMIALKYYGAKERWKDIYQANRSTIPNPDEIKAGQRLIIPLGDSR